jgi:hypothetical protein
MPTKRLRTRTFKLTPEDDDKLLTLALRQNMTPDEWILHQIREAE